MGRKRGFPTSACAPSTPRRDPVERGRPHRGQPHRRSRRRDVAGRDSIGPPEAHASVALSGGERCLRSSEPTIAGPRACAPRPPPLLGRVRTRLEPLGNEAKALRILRVAGEFSVPRSGSVRVMRASLGRPRPGQSPPAAGDRPVRRRARDFRACRSASSRSPAARASSLSEMSACACPLTSPSAFPAATACSYERCCRSATTPHRRGHDQRR